jgi:hypothetical protein
MIGAAHPMTLGQPQGYTSTRRWKSFASLDDRRPTMDDDAIVVMGLIFFSMLAVFWGLLGLAVRQSATANASAPAAAPGLA